LRLRFNIPLMIRSYLKNMIEVTEVSEAGNFGQAMSLCSRASRILRGEVLEVGAWNSNHLSLLALATTSKQAARLKDSAGDFYADDYLKI
jgi:hypothetical protein